MRRALRVALLGMSLVLLTACTPTVGQPLAEVTASCQGYTARLSLEHRDAQADPLSPYLVRAVRWRAVVEGLPAAPSLPEFGPPVRVHLETFTVRSQRGVRVDTFDGELRSLGPYIVQEGPLLLSDAFGPLQSGDKGEVFLTVTLPTGRQLWTPHITFRLRAPVDAPEIETTGTATVAEYPCPGG